MVSASAPEPDPLAYAAAPVIDGVRSRFVDTATGLRLHLLEAGTPGRPVVVLLHGFPELAYSWRHQLPALAAAGYHVIAPDQRGYGRTTGWDGRYAADLVPYRQFNLAKDVLALLRALGVAEVAAVVGHDFGSFVAGCCALMRPDLFRAVALMSAPFGGAPRLGAAPPLDVPAALAALDPPRQHYQWYFSTPQADRDMHGPPGGLHAFLRAYYHVKSADWPANRPHPLAGWSAAALAVLPPYYVMPAGLGMPAAVAPFAPAADAAARCAWLPDADLAVYTAEFARTGFQGGLNWYRCITDPAQMGELQLFDGAAITVPACYIAGAADWGIYQSPGAFERMQREVCRRMRAVHLLPGAGHWVQQEQPAPVTALLLEFLRQAADDARA
ncbi:MAG: alpha/beta hydrolase [Geminicoccaceae bacterium]